MMMIDVTPDEWIQRLEQQQLQQQSQQCNNNNSNNKKKKNLLDTLPTTGWNVSNCRRLASWVTTTITTITTTTTAVHTTTDSFCYSILTRCLTVWNNDELIYEACVTHNHAALWKTLHHQHQQQQHLSKKDHAAALSALALLWETLHRIEQLQQQQRQVNHNTTTAWWIPDLAMSNDWRATVRMLVHSLLLNDDDDDDDNKTTTILPPEQWKITATFLLTTLLRYEETDWLLEMESNNHNNDNNNNNNYSYEGLLATLRQEAVRLQDPQMPASPYTRLSLQCLSLYVAIVAHIRCAQDDHQWLTQTMELVMHAACGSDECPHRWTHYSSSSSSSSSSSFTVESWAMDTWVTYLQCNYDASPSSFFPTLIMTRTEKAWRNVSTTTASSSSYWWLYTLMSASSQTRILARECLQRVWEQQQQQEGIRLDSFLRQLVSNGNNRESLVLLHHLLQEARNSLHHDHLSRLIWHDGVNEALVYQCWALLTTVPTTRQTCVLLDIVQTILALKEETRGAVLSSLSAESVEDIICILNHPTNDPVESCVTVDTGESTPPMNNLSMIMATDVDVTFAAVQPPESSFDDTPVDHSLQFAAAGLLATLAKRADVSGDDVEHVHLLQKRISETLHAFVADEASAFLCPTSRSSLDLSTRRMRIVSELVRDTHNEGYLSMTALSVENRFRDAANMSTQKIARLRKHLEESRQREKQLRQENEAAHRQRSKLARIAETQMAVRVRAATSKAKMQISVHQNERAKAETERERSVRQVETMQARLSSAQEELVALRENQVAARRTIQDQEKVIATLRENEQEVTDKLATCELEVRNLHTKVEEVTELYSASGANEQELENQLAEQVDRTESAESNEEEVRESLENLFADMVGLARLYEKLERDFNATKTGQSGNLKELKKRLAVEESQRVALEDKVRQLQRENEDLSNKCDRTRKKLDDERKERKRVVERKSRHKSDDKSSYFSHLEKSAHDRLSSKTASRNTTTEKSSSSLLGMSQLQLERDHGKSRSKPSRSNKENDRSQRRSFKRNVRE